MAEVYEFDRKSRFSPEPFDRIEPLAQPWRIKGVLPTRGVAFLVGQSKAGKTFVALDMALRLAAGEARIFGRKAKRCGTACVAAEDPNGCRARVSAWRRKRPRPGPTPFELIGQGVNLLDADDMADLRVTLTEIDERLTAQGAPLGVVVLDTLSRCIPGVDENNSIDMSRALAALNALAEALGVLILVVAHFGKAGAERGIRGWSGLDANADATITVERDGDDHNLRTLTFAKVKNGVDGATLGFRLEAVDLGILDEDGETLSSCVVAYEATPADRSTRRVKALSAPEQLVLRAVRNVTDHGPTHPPPVTALGVRPGQKAVTREDVRARALASGLAQDGEKSNTVNQRFSRALEGIAAKGAVRVEGGLIWLP